MKKIIFATQIIFMSAILIPAYAGGFPIAGIGHKIVNDNMKSAGLHFRKMKNHDWVNYQTAQQFALDFPQATDVTWYEGDFAEATFNSGGTFETAYYDDNNDLVGTTQDVSISNLSEKAQEKINRDYRGYQINRVIFFKDNEYNDTDMNLYSTQFEDQDSYFAEISNGTKNLVIQISTDGDVSFFQNL